MCNHCGGAIKRPRKGKKYCCQRCRRQAWGRKRKKVQVRKLGGEWAVIIKMERYETWEQAIRRVMR